MLTNPSHLSREQEQLLQEIDAFRRAHPACIHNFGPEKLVYLHEHTQMARNEGALFLLAPRYDFHEILFFVDSIDHLPAALSALIHKQGAEKRYRITLNYKQLDPENENDQTRALFQAGFIRCKRITRMRVDDLEKDKKHRQRLLNLTAHITLAPEWAVPGDEEEILNLLREEFDPIADNLPTLDEIRQHIENRQVAIIRNDGQILAAHYFYTKNSTYYGLYDITIKEHRGDFLFLKIALFVDDYFKQNNIRFSRIYGWRDVENKRFLREDLNAGKVWENIFTDCFINQIPS